MRKPILLALVSALLVAVGTLSIGSPAEAGHRRHHSGWGHVQTVHHYGYYPRYNHVYRTHVVTDPYAYRYEPRGYYPYYNSAYWKPAHAKRCRKRYGYVQPAYYPAWGYSHRGYNHSAWHAEHHGRHRLGHW